MFSEWFLHSFPDPTAWYVYKHGAVIHTFDVTGIKHVWLIFEHVL